MSVMWNQRRIGSVRLALEQEAEALFNRALCICFRLTSLPLGGDAEAARHFDVVIVRLLLRHANG